MRYTTQTGWSSRNFEKRGQVRVTLCILLASGSVASAVDQSAPPTPPAPAEATTTPAPTPASQPTPSADDPVLDDAALDDAALEAAAASAEDDLLIFQDLPVVVSAGRQEQRINQSSVPISVINSDDIRYSGRFSIADMLRYVPGVAVHRMERGTIAVGVRGMHDQYADRTLVLLNGRSTSNPAFGASDLTQLSAVPLDIDRVEVVRGPGGALWGANAFNGVINVLTKRPEDTPGFAASSQINHFGDTFNQFRWAAKKNNFAFKLSGSFDERETSEDAIANDDFSSRDFRRGGVLDAEGVYSFDDKTKLRFGASVGNFEQGPGDFVGFVAPDDIRVQNNRFFAKLEMKPSDSVEGYIQAFSNLSDNNYPSAITYNAGEHDLETQWTVKSGNHTLLFGGNVRYSTVDTEVTRPEDIRLAGSPYGETTVGLFVGDRYQVTERLALEGQLRGDSYTGTGLDWAARFAALFALDSEQRHVIRGAVAKAFRAPTPIVRDLRALRSLLPSPPFPANTFGVRVSSEPDMENEELYSLEAGYTGVLANGLTLRADAYYHDYQDLIGGRIPSQRPLVIILRNNSDATAWGIETEASYRADKWTGSLWYAYNELNLESADRAIRSLQSPKHNVGATLRWEFMTDTTLSASYRFTDSTRRDRTDIIGVSHSLDLVLTHTFWNGRADAQIGVYDLLDSTGEPLSAAGSAVATPTHGRTFFVGVTLRF
jgi:outer membrane receptor for ferrienterochelin and colicin